MKIKILAYDEHSKKNQFSKFFFNYQNWESELSTQFLNYSVTSFLIGFVVFSVESTSLIPSFFLFLKLQFLRFPRNILSGIC